jgi:tripartite-type tricarboxylate transporter receptor subunit TctC
MYRRSPRGTPPEIIERLNREANTGLANPTIKARFAEVGTIPMIFTPEKFAAYVAAEAEKWGKVVRAANIKPD